MQHLTRKAVTAALILSWCSGAVADNALAQPHQARIPEPTKTNVILQAFNWKFAHVELALPELKGIGYTYVLVSPPQKSHPSTEWWGRYQPVDFTKIDGPLGTAAQFASMNAKADQLGVKILVDAVLNHMADHPDYVTKDSGGQVINLQYPRFSSNDFHLPRIEIASDPLTGWLGLPDLKTESPYVRGEAKNYLRMLVDDYQVDGFRFDAIRHIEDPFFEDVLQAVPQQQLFLFGEYVTANPQDIGPYLDSMDAYDFPLARTMKEAFAWGGDLRTLVAPRDAQKALHGVNAVTWVKHHDLAAPREDEAERAQWDYWRIGGRSGGVDEILAYAYILGRREGTPLVYVDKYNHPMVRAGVRFHNLALGQAMHWLIKAQNQLAWQRGEELLVAINKHGDRWDPGTLDTTLKAGDYLDLVSGDEFNVGGDHKLNGLALDGSSAAFLVRLVSAP